MRLGNTKLRRPTPADKFEYTEEELEEIRLTKQTLIRAEINLGQANKVWRELHFQTSAFLIPPMQVASKVAHAKHLRYDARKMRRVAYLNYIKAVMPERLMLLRIGTVGTVVGGYIRERLYQESYMEKILPKEKL